MEPADRAPDGRLGRLTGIQLRARVAPLAFLYYLSRPKVSIDGGPEFRVRWGVNQLSVPPGRHHLRVWFSYFFWSRANEATIEVDVPAVGAVGVTYKSRWTVLVPGRIAQDTP